ncbi:LAMI_0G06458g1_1 [Lachancea mirantina]|uniref:LAMI_0G06458g1_1 n=1 Tax=Lachancea mirantina TaxID=1230905 RepID=A0A1G4K9D6_9SACH|nr:LAMI_0G06458g1_1 [Lachancea mirantina]
MSDEKDLLEKNSDIPDGGFGWCVVLACFIYSMTCWGANASYSIYLEHYLNDDVFKGANKLDFAAIGGITFGSGLMFAPAVIYLYHRFGVQFVIAMGAVFQGVSLMLAAFSVKLWQIYLTQGVLLSFGLAFIYIPSLILLPHWFEKKRALAMGIAASGSGVGGIIFNLGIQAIIEAKNIKWALIAQFVICMTLNSIALPLSRIPRRTSRQRVKFSQFCDREFLSNAGLWLLLGWAFFTMLGYVVVLYSLSAFTVSLGYSPRQGSYVECVTSIGWAVGRPVVGYMSDRWGTLTIGVWVHLFMAILCWSMWIPCRNFATVIAFGLLQGVFMGTIWATIGSVTARVVGLRRMTSAFSLFWISVAVAGLVTPVIGLKLVEGRGSEAYKWTAVFSGFGYFGASLFQYILRGYLIAQDTEGLLGEGQSTSKFASVVKSLHCFKGLPRKV